MEYTSINHYIELMAACQKKHRSPHIGVLMYSVAELVISGSIDSPFIKINDTLKNRFEENWHKYIMSTKGDIQVALGHIRTESYVVGCGITLLVIDHALFRIMNDHHGARIFTEAIKTTLFSPHHYQVREQISESRKYEPTVTSQTVLSNSHKIDFSTLDPYRDQSLRDYQKKGKAAIYQMWSKTRSVMLQMPTGTGKTKLFVSIAKDLFDWGTQRKQPVKILFVAHRIELIDQIDETLGIKYNLPHGIIQAQSREQRNYALQVASVQTLTRRIDRWLRVKFDIIIIDEAHHVKAQSYRKILHAFPEAKVLGVTATPYRMSHEGFRPEFDDIIISDPVSQFIRDGWLCDYEYYSIRPESLIQRDINSITKFAIDGDYLEDAIVKIMDKDEIRAGIVSTYEQYAKGKKGIVYTITKAHNKNVCKQYLDRGYRAVAIDDKTPSSLRKKYVNDFKAGLIDIICNVNIFSEGFDCPDLEFIQLARPTKSLSLYLQQVGRGLRPAKGKDKLIILDNVGIYNQFGFPSTKRQWRHHFEGTHIEDDELYGINSSNSTDGRKVLYIDNIQEGNERVEMLHSTVEEATGGLPINITQDDISNEASFMHYLQEIGKDQAEIRRIMKGIEVEIDPRIRKIFNPDHKSILYLTMIR